MKANEIKEVLKRHDEVLVAYLYGSAVKGYERKDSDIDIGLLLSDDFEPDALYPAQIAGEIKKKIGSKREADVRVLNDRPFGFLFQVVKEGEVILSTDEGRRAEFESFVVNRYLDFKPFYEQYDEKRKERLLA